MFNKCNSTFLSAGDCLLTLIPYTVPSVNIIMSTYSIRESGPTLKGMLISNLPVVDFSIILKGCKY